MTSHLFNSIKGSVNIVTGCANGLGRATLKHLLQKECSGVIGIDLHAEDLSLEDVKDIDDRLLLRKHRTDDEKAVEDTLELGVKKFGRIDNVINVAGVSTAFSLVGLQNKEVYGLGHLKDMMAMNTVGTFNVSRIAIKHMIDYRLANPKSAKPNCIIHTSCISTEDPVWGQTGYSCSKGGIDSMTLQMARELAPYGIRTNTINVGFFHTKLIRATSPEVQDFLSESVNLLPNRLGEPDEFARLVQTIIENQMLNGSCIRLDAGAHPVIRPGM